MRIRKKQLIDFLRDVEKLPDNPTVLSRYGFKKVALDKATYLVPMTKAEAVKTLASENGISKTEARAILDKEPYCDTPSSGVCAKRAGCKSCDTVARSDGFWLCYCTS